MWLFSQQNWLLTQPLPAQTKWRSIYGVPDEHSLPQSVSTCLVLSFFGQSSQPPAVTIPMALVPMALRWSYLCSQNPMY